MSMEESIKTFYDSSEAYDLTRSFRKINTPSEFAKENLFYVQEAGYLKSIKTHISQREQLDSFLFLIVLSGKGHFTYKGVTNELEPGSCLLVNCRYTYKHQSSEADPWELMWLHFNGKNTRPYTAYFEGNNPEGIFQTENISDYATIIKTCLELENRNDITSEFILSKMITDLLTLCITANSNISGKNSLEKMKLIKEYVDKNYKNKISLEAIAREFFTSKFYLAREFKKAFGMTIGDYISTKRITFSKELLRFSNKTIEEISALSGIPDTNYFAKVFRKLEDCSPSEYRRKW